VYATITLRIYATVPSDIYATFSSRTLEERNMDVTNTAADRAGTARTIKVSGKLAVGSPGGGFDQAISLSERSLGANISPFVDLTEFVMSQPVFRPHPHAGFSAVTYMFEDSPGSFANRWSKGESQLIGPGTLHWTQAGIGMVHEEIPTEPGIGCHGLQMFVKLAAVDELAPPQAFHVDTSRIIEITSQPGVRLRLLAGDAFGNSAGLPIRNNLVLLDCHLEAGARIAFDAPSPQNTFVFVQRGAIEVDNTELHAHSAAVFNHVGDHVAVTAHTKTSFLFGSGLPLNEPSFAQGPFMMSTRERLDEARIAFQRGDMGHLSPSF
jgi:redox-sensitive bicupin YhaK (pirin superfamily)